MAALDTAGSLLTRALGGVSLSHLLEGGEGCGSDSDSGSGSSVCLDGMKSLSDKQDEQAEVQVVKEIMKEVEKEVEVDTDGFSSMVIGREIEQVMLKSKTKTKSEAEAEIERETGTDLYWHNLLVANDIFDLPSLLQSADTAVKNDKNENENELRISQLPIFKEKFILGMTNADIGTGANRRTGTGGSEGDQNDFKKKIPVDVKKVTKLEENSLISKAINILKYKNKYPYNSTDNDNDNDNDSEISPHQHIYKSESLKSELSETQTCQIAATHYFPAAQSVVAHVEGELYEERTGLKVLHEIIFEWRNYEGEYYSPPPIPGQSNNNNNKGEDSNSDSDSASSSSDGNKGKGEKVVDGEKEKGKEKGIGKGKGKGKEDSVPVPVDGKQAEEDYYLEYPRESRENRYQRKLAEAMRGESVSQCVSQWIEWRDRGEYENMRTLHLIEYVCLSVRVEGEALILLQTSHLTLSLLFSSNVVSSYLISSLLFFSHLISRLLFTSHLIAFHLCIPHWSP